MIQKLVYSIKKDPVVTGSYPVGLGKLFITDSLNDYFPIPWNV
jgi:hypothetical protein